MKEIIQFVDRYVNGRTCHTAELIYALEQGKLEGVYSDQMSFSNLKYSRTAFQLDLFIVSNEKIYLLGQNGKRKELRKDFSGVSLFRFEMAKRRSTDKITGLFRFISASGRDVPAEALVSAIAEVSLDSEKPMLSMVEDQVLYRDQPTDSGFKPVAFQANHHFSVVNKNKLHYAYYGKSFDVNPQDYTRKDSADSIPPFISIER